MNIIKRKKLSGADGFTIVELLIVVVVIAILAAITVVAYANIQNRARASEASSALVQAKKQLDLYRIDNGGYPTTGNLAVAGVPGSDKLQYTSDGTAYCITATSGNVSYKVTNTDNPAPGGCAGHGQGGVAAITNLIANPSVEADIVTPNAPYYSAPISIDSTKSVAGAKSAKVTTNNPTLYQGMMWAMPDVSDGTTYTCSVSVMGTPGRDIRVSGRAHAVGGGVNGESYGLKTVTLSNSWQRVSVVFTAPANTATMYLQYRLATAESGVEIWGDAAMCTEGSKVHTYADGNSPDWVWNGTANNSTSTGPAL